MIIPRDISRGDVIGVTAPSFGVNDPTDFCRFENAKMRLEERGYVIRETPNVYTADQSGRSSPAQQRVDELNSLLEDDSVTCIVSAKGGDYQFEMLPLMDWSVVEDNPKWIQGYSDNTTLLFKITAEHDIATMYCGNYGDFGMEPWHRSVVENLEFLEGTRAEQESFPYHSVDFVDRVTGLEPFGDDEPTVWRSSVGDVRFSGRLIGGCMDVLQWFHKTGAADPQDFISRYGSEGIVWYMETYDMTGKAVCDMLHNMADDGWFIDCEGFVFGRPLFYTSKREYGELVMDALKDLELPILLDADVGHKAPRMSFINGAKAEFDFHGGSCTLSYDMR